MARHVEAQANLETFHWYERERELRLQFLPCDVVLPRLGTIREVAAVHQALLVMKGGDAFPSKKDRFEGTIDVWWIVRTLSPSRIFAENDFLLFLTQTTEGC